MADDQAPSAEFRPPAESSNFAQAEVIAWDAIAGTNIIRLRGVDLVNLQSLMGSEVSLIRAGDRIVLMRYLNSWAVLGRIEVPGSEQRAFGVASQRVSAAVSTASTSFVALSGGPAVTVYIGSSRRAKVELSSYMNGHDAIAYAGFRVTGASTIAPINRWSVAIGAASTGGVVPDVWANATRTVNLSADDGLNEGLNTFTMEYQCVGNPSGGLAQFSDREISIQPF